MSDTALHLDDGTLVRVLDGSLLPGESPEHLADCERCLERLGELEETSAVVSFARVAAGRAGPAGGSLMRRTGLAGRFRAVAAAAALVLLLSSALVGAVPRLRATLAELIGLGERQPTSSLVEPVVSAPVARGWLEASFVPAADTLGVTVESFQDSGDLVLLPVGGSTAAARAAGESGEIPELVIRSSGVLIRNRAGSGDRYEIRVPESVEWVVVTIGGRHVTTVRRDIFGDGFRVPITGG